MTNAPANMAASIEEVNEGGEIILYPAQIGQSSLLDMHFIHSTTREIQIYFRSCIANFPNISRAHSPQTSSSFLNICSLKRLCNLQPHCLKSIRSWVLIYVVYAGVTSFLELEESRRCCCCCCCCCCMFCHVAHKLRTV